MTRKAPVTQAQLARMIRAAREEGLTVTGIKPDGTVLVTPIADSDIAEPESESEDWNDE